MAHASRSDVPAVARKLLAEQYSIHFNVWTLPDLVEFVSKCQAEFGLPFGLEWLVCSENEVILILRKHSHERGTILRLRRGACAMISVDRVLSFNYPRRELAVAGWACLDDRMPPDELWLECDGLRVPALTGLPRPDVARLHNAPSLDRAGFLARFPVSRDGAG